MSLTAISGPCLEATRLVLSDATNGLNPLVAANYAAFGAGLFSVDFTPGTSYQYFQANAGPDDLDESTPAKYPMVFHYTAQSSNEHQQYGPGFSGPVGQTLSFHFTDKGSRLSNRLEKIGDLLEAVMNALFSDGNWPQSYGANAVCAKYPMTRSPIEQEGENWRQGFTFHFMFLVVAN